MLMKTDSNSVNMSGWARALGRRASGSTTTVQPGRLCDGEVRVTSGGVAHLFNEARQPCGKRSAGAGQEIPY